jgi:hypothetical protein
MQMWRSPGANVVSCCSSCGGALPVGDREQLAVVAEAAGAVVELRELDEGACAVRQ